MVLFLASLSFGLMTEISKDNRVSDTVFCVETGNAEGASDTSVLNTALSLSCAPTDVNEQMIVMHRTSKKTRFLVELHKDS
jgi:hypothetical protein